jgi:hypothetical protein
MTLPHVHQSGAPCLACDVETIRDRAAVMSPSRQADLGPALARIEAALAEREHLEKGCAIARGYLEEFESTERDPWLLAERARLSPPVERACENSSVAFRAMATPQCVLALLDENARLVALLEKLHHALGGRPSHGSPDADAACVLDWIRDAKNPVEPLL